MHGLNLKKGKAVLKAFIKKLNEPNLKANELCVYQGKEFYSKLTQEWLDNYGAFNQFSTS